MTRRLICGLTAFLIVMAPSAAMAQPLCSLPLPEPIKNEWQCP